MINYKEILEERLIESRNRNVAMAKEYDSFFGISLKEGEVHPTDAHRAINYYQNLVELKKLLELWNQCFGDDVTITAEKDLTTLLEEVKKGIAGLMIKGI